MKKTLSAFLSAVLLMTALCVTGLPVSADSVYEGFAYTAKDGGITITGYTGAEATVKVPAEIDGLPVRKIGDRAFYQNETVTAVVLPSGLESVGASAFADCSALVGVFVPDSVTEIGAWAFSNCALLETVLLPSGLTEIAERTFSNCLALDNVQLPATLEKIGAYAFHFCRGLTAVSTPKTLTEIGDGAFYYCTALRTLTLSESVKRIGAYAFYYCSALSGLTVSGTEEIGEMAFYNCTGLSSVTVGEGTKTLGKSAFMGCTKLCEITLPASVTEIGQYAVGYLDEQTKQTGFTVCGDVETAAETYATNNGFHFALRTDTVFTDVDDSQWFADAVHYMNRNGYIKGTSNTTFSPNVTVSRGMFVTILYRIAGAPASGYFPIFEDVKRNRYDTDAIMWAYANGVVKGVSSNAFAPDEQVTREQMATILYRFAQKQAYDTDASVSLERFSDAAEISGFAKEAVAYAVAEELFIGNNLGQFCPQKSASRAEAAQLLARFCRRHDTHE